MPPLLIALAICLSGLTGLSRPASAQQAVDPNRSGIDMQKFEAEDKARPPVRGGVVFIGASSIGAVDQSGRVVSRHSHRQPRLRRFGDGRQRGVRQTRRHPARAAYRRALRR